MATEFVRKHLKAVVSVAYKQSIPPTHTHVCTHKHTHTMQTYFFEGIHFALKWGDFNMRSRMSSRKSSTAVTKSGWKRIHSSLIPDRSSGILTSLCWKQNKQKKGQIKALLVLVFCFRLQWCTKSRFSNHYRPFNQWISESITCTLEIETTKPIV